MVVILARHPSWWYGKPASAAFEGWLDSLMALSGPVHAAVHTVQDVVKVSLPRSETSSGLDNVHWDRSCVMFVLSITSDLWLA